MHEITCNNWLTKRVSKLEQLGVRQSWIRSDGASSLLLREYRGWHRPWLHRGPFRPHPGLNFVQPHRRIGRRHHDRVHVVRRLRLFPFPNGHRFRQLLHSHLHPWLIIILYFNYYLLIIIKIVSFFLQCWNMLDRPTGLWWPICRLPYFTHWARQCCRGSPGPSGTGECWAWSRLSRWPCRLSLTGSFLKALGNVLYHYSLLKLYMRPSTYKIETKQKGFHLFFIG